MDNYDIFIGLIFGIVLTGLYCRIKNNLFIKNKIMKEIDEMLNIFNKDETL
jgi:hypothetical protein